MANRSLGKILKICMSTGFVPVVLMFIAFTLSCCKKDPPTPEECIDEHGLPCLTTEGKNMFACKLNGEVFIADVDYSVGGPIALAAYLNSDNYFTIQATMENDTEYKDVKIRSYFDYEQPEQSIHVPNSYVKGSTNYFAIGTNCESYYYDTLNKGIITIVEIDTINRICSGRFEMDLINDNCSTNELKVTHGRFDVIYQ